VIGTSSGWGRATVPGPSMPQRLVGCTARHARLRVDPTIARILTATVGV
jgi:hypothetical protein